jgi:hypothetical protein
MKLARDHLGHKHLHGDCSFSEITVWDYLMACKDLAWSKIINAKTLNLHLPLEIQFASHRKKIKTGEHFVKVINLGAQILNVNLVWENSCILSPTDWSILENTSYTPKGIPLTFDFGHFMLKKDRKTVLSQIDKFFLIYGKDIKHLHLHINNFRSDLHMNDPQRVKQFLGTKRFNRLIKDRTYIFEEG